MEDRAPTASVGDAGSAEPVVRRARQADRDAAVATVVASFPQDPAWRYMCGDDLDRVAPLFAGALFDLRVDVGAVYLAGHDAAAVSLWEPPGGLIAQQDRERVWGEFADRAGPRVWQRIQAYDAAVHAVEPAYPFWYLGVLGTRPEHRARGMATAVLRPVLDLADEQGLPCCLETSSEKNLAFYAGRGFHVTAQIALPDAGPPTWWLERPAPQRL